MKNDSMSFFNLLTLVFITLKLTNYIDWSWWLVLLPTYFPIAMVLLFTAIIGICGFIIMVIDCIKIKYR